MMKVLVIGGVAAGTKVAAKLKRENGDAQVKILTKSKEISYAGCGLPYYVGNLIEERGKLIVNTPQSFSKLTGAEVETGVEAVALDREKKVVKAVHLEDGQEQEYPYDKLVIATGASPIKPPIDGVDLENVFYMRTPDDADALKASVAKGAIKRAVVAGGGFIGLEVAENLKSQGVKVTVLDMADQILPGFDPEIAAYAEDHLAENGIMVLTNTKLEAVLGEGKVEKVQTQKRAIKADAIVMALGIRPNTEFLASSGITLASNRTILVNSYLQTNDEDIYALGDCAMVTNRITGKEAWSPMGSSANIEGRIAAKNMNGGSFAYPGVLGTGIVKLPGMNAGRTGLTEKAAKEAGYNPITVIGVVDDKAHYYPGASSFVIKLTAETSSGRLLGLQVFGAGAVDKITDIAVVGVSQHMKLHDFDTLDFAYAPPFSTAIHPFVTACYILENKIDSHFDSMSPAEYAKGAARDYIVLDVQPAPAIPNARWIDLASVNGPIEGLEKDAKLLLVCAKGKRGYFLQNRLKALGYTNTKALEGGAFFNEVKVPRSGKKLSAAEIKRVKGLGCLQDKRYDDVFNVRVITRNGKLTAAEQLKIAEAAEKFGSGEVTMTTRLTLEIQGVNYDNLEAIFAFLEEAGLKTGGTGSKVRPVVSCKGTTCQYGLIDTFALSEKLHDLFYTGYHDVSLPHKFKIAVGGCPNNCVKPDLNDLGIIGQRVPEIDLSKCKGCKNCQVQNTCPIKVASLIDGKIQIPTEACNHCGRCVDKCPFGAVTESVTGYKVYIGGRWGKKVAEGRALDRIFTSEEEVVDVVERTILFFRDEGLSGERLADTVARLGFDYVQDKLLNSKIDKTKILEKNVVGGATC